MSALLTVNDLSAAYGPFPALRDINISVGQGELVALVGANGAGKTTTLRCVSGVVRPLSGTVRFEGERLDLRYPHKVVDAGIVQVPEGRQLFPGLSVEDNLLVGASCRRARATRMKTLKEVYDLFPKLRERSKQLGGTLSGGEQQMVAIGRALMAKPKLLLLDEPSLGLAPLIVKQLFKTISKINSDGLAMLLVEQNVANAIEVASRTYLLESGRIQLEGKSSEVGQNSKITEMYFGLGAKEAI